MNEYKYHQLPNDLQVKIQNHDKRFMPQESHPPWFWIKWFKIINEYDDHTEAQLFSFFMSNGE